jgi:hypothetical protein
VAGNYVTKFEHIRMPVRHLIYLRGNLEHSVSVSSQSETQFVILSLKKDVLIEQSPNWFDEILSDDETGATTCKHTRRVCSNNPIGSPKYKATNFSNGTDFPLYDPSFVREIGGSAFESLFS